MREQDAPEVARRPETRRMQALRHELSERYLAERDLNPLRGRRLGNRDYDAGYRMAMEDAARIVRYGLVEPCRECGTPKRNDEACYATDECSLASLEWLGAAPGGSRDPKDNE